MTALDPKGTDRSAKLSALFDAALDLSPDQRGAFFRNLAEAGDTDPSLINEVTSLLNSLGDADDFFDAPIFGATMIAALEDGHHRPDPLVPGTIIGDFEILEEIGSGAFAFVYLAKQISLNRRVALKVSSNINDEAQTMAMLNHANIVGVYSEAVAHGGNMRFVCMQYIPGLNLAQIIAALAKRRANALNGQSILDPIEAAKGANEIAFNPSLAREREALARLNFPEAVASLGSRLAEALEFAHQRGALHLDVKPANILVDTFGRPLLSDFNVAWRPSDASTPEEQPLIRGGTPAYMAPEQLAVFQSTDGTPLPNVGKSADLYSLGMVLWELLRGEKPDLAELAAGGFSADGSPTRNAPPLLEDVIARCLTSDPTHRLASAAELMEKLESFQVLQKVHMALPKPGPMTRLSQRWPVWSLILVPMAPQWTGTLLVAAYALLRPSLQLTIEQKLTFVRVVRTYTAISYPTGIILSLSVILPFHRIWRRRNGFFDATAADELATARKQALKMPFWRVAINTLTWLPSILVIGIANLIINDHFNPSGFLHSSIAIVLAWIIATSYAALYNTFVALRIYYPRLLPASGILTSVVREELKPMRKWLKAFPLVALFIPLFAALILIGVEPRDLPPGKFRYLQILLVSLITCGGAGLFLVMKVVERLNQTISALDLSAESNS